MDHEPDDDTAETTAPAEDVADCAEVEGFGHGTPVLKSFGLLSDFGASTSNPTITINGGEPLGPSSVVKHNRDPLH